MIKKISIILLSLILAAVAATSLALGLTTGKSNGDAAENGTAQGGSTVDGDPSGGNTGNGDSGNNDASGGSSGGNTDNGTNGGGTSGGNETNGDNNGGSTAPVTHVCVFVYTKDVECCEENGYKLFTCKDPDCGKTEKRDFFAPSGHDYDWVTHKATCTSDWSQTYECKRCGDVKETRTVEGSKTDHEYGEYTSNNDATCGKDGTKTAVCLNCGAENTVTDEGTATGNHEYGEYKPNGDATCIGDGTETAVCAVCGAKDSRTVPDSKGDHNYRWTVIKDTCTEVEKSGVCTLCGAVTQYVEITHDVFHDYTWTETKKATCTEDGSRTGVCNKCGCTTTETVNAAGHKVTDMTTGKCSVCGELVGICNEKIYIEPKDNNGGGDFGTVYFEVVVINPVNNRTANGLPIMKFELYIVQTYEVGGQSKTTREKAELESPDTIGSKYEINLFSLTDNCTVNMRGVVDYSVDEDGRWIMMHLDGWDTSSVLDYSYSAAREFQY